MVNTNEAGSSSARRRRSRRVHQRSRISVLDVFRETHRQKKRNSASERDSASAALADSTARRIGVDEETLRRHVYEHLDTLMNCVRLDAATDLEDFPKLQSSVLNYGFQDLSNLSQAQLTGKDVRNSITASLRKFEPRLIEDSVKVEIVALEGDAQQRVSVHVTADLIADPADIPVEFEADIDTGTGKVNLSSGKI